MVVYAQSLGAVRQKAWDLTRLQTSLEDRIVGFEEEVSNGCTPVFGGAQAGRGRAGDIHRLVDQLSSLNLAA